jgi:hypothetical protein
MDRVVAYWLVHAGRRHSLSVILQRILTESFTRMSLVIHAHGVSLFASGTMPVPFRVMSNAVIECLRALLKKRPSLFTLKDRTTLIDFHLFPIVDMEVSKALFLKALIRATLRVLPLYAPFVEACFREELGRFQQTETVLSLLTLIQREE